MAETRFLWNDQMAQFPNGPARVLFFAMEYLKKACIPDVANEVWRDRGHGGYPFYGGDIELWRAPSAAWNIGNEDCRRILVRLGHSDVIKFRIYGAAFNDVLNMEVLGIVGDGVVDYNISLDEAIARQRNDEANNNGQGAGLNNDFM